MSNGKLNLSLLFRALQLPEAREMKQQSAETRIGSPVGEDFDSIFGIYQSLAEIECERLERA